MNTHLYIEEPVLSASLYSMSYSYLLPSVCNKPTKASCQSTSLSFFHGELFIEEPDGPGATEIPGLINSFALSDIAVMVVFSRVRSHRRGRRPQPSRLVAASCRAAKETKGRRGGEVRHPRTVRGVLCCLWGKENILIFPLFFGDIC